MNENVYTCILKDGTSRTVLQPFIAYDDNAAARTVREAIRADESIRAIAMQERISLHKVCQIVSEGGFFDVKPCNIEECVANKQYFRRFAQVVFAEMALQKANEDEAEVMNDPETKEAFYHDICENTEIPSDEYMKGELDDDQV